VAAILKSRSQGALLRRDNALGGTGSISRRPRPLTIGLAGPPALTRLIACGGCCGKQVTFDLNHDARVFAVGLAVVPRRGERVTQAEVSGCSRRNRGSVRNTHGSHPRTGVSSWVRLRQLPGCRCVRAGRRRCAGPTRHRSGLAGSCVAAGATADRRSSFSGALSRPSKGSATGRPNALGAKALVGRAEAGMAESPFPSSSPAPVSQARGGRSVALARLLYRATGGRANQVPFSGRSR